MNKLINFYKLCFFFNLISSIYFFCISTYQNLNSNINNTFFILLTINLIKIFNQGYIIKYLSQNILTIYKKLLTVEKITDFFKFLICNYFISNQEKICNIITLCISLVLLYINYIVIIFYSLYMCCKNIQIRNENTELIIVNEYTNLDVTNQIVNSSNTQNYNITNYSITNINNTICTICLEEEKINENWGKLYCGHCFHYKCITNWIQINNVCPICRYFISSV